MNKQPRQQSFYSRVNRTRRQQAEAALHEVLDQSSRPGFFGSCTVELTINDGTIQNIRRRVEKVDRLLDPVNKRTP